MASCDQIKQPMISRLVLVAESAINNLGTPKTISACPKLSRHAEKFSWRADLLISEYGLS